MRHRLGELYLAQGDLAEAGSEFLAVRAMVERTGDLVGMAYALLGVGAVRLAEDKLDEAERVLAEALDKAREAGSRFLEGRARVALAELSQRYGDWSAAAEHLDRSDELFRAIGAAVWQDRVSQLRRRSPGTGQRGITGR